MSVLNVAVKLKRVLEQILLKQYRHTKRFAKNGNTEHNRRLPVNSFVVLI